MDRDVFVKGNKAGLIERVGVVDISPKSADTIIVHVSQCFYYSIWPHGSSPSDIVASIENIQVTILKLLRR